jgi:hypothetical protein
MAEARQGAHGTARPTPTPRTGTPAPQTKLAVESEDYCAEDDVDQENQADQEKRP